MRNWVFIVFVMFFANAQADVTGVTDVKIIAQLLEQYKLLVQQLKEVRSQSKTLKELKTLYEDGKAFRNKIKNLDKESVNKLVSANMNAMFSSEMMEDGSDVSNYISELKRNLEEDLLSVVPESKERMSRIIDHQKALLDRFEIILNIDKLLEKNMAEVKKDIGVRKASQIQAESNTILSLIASMEAKQKLKSEFQEESNSKQSVVMDDQIQRVYKSMETGRW